MNPARFGLGAALVFALVSTAGGRAVAASPSQSLGFVVCQAFAVPASVQASGTNELVGDIVLHCSTIPFEGDPSQNTLVTNASVALNVNIADPGEAVLVINDNTCSSPSAVGSTFGGCGAADPRFQDPQLGVLAASNILEWTNVSFPVPGASASGVPVADCDTDPSACFPFTTTLRITGIHADVSPLGLPSRAVVAFVSLTNPTDIPITNNVLPVGVTSDGPDLAGPSNPDLVLGVRCATSGLPRHVSPGGSDEPLGELLLVCDNVLESASGSSVTFDLALSLNAPVSNTGGDPPVLVINENDCASPASVGSTFGSCGAPDSTFQDPQVGALDSSGGVVWRNLTFPVPDAASGGKTTLKIRGLRADVATSFTGSAVQVTATVAAGVPLTKNTANLGAAIEASVLTPAGGETGLIVCQSFTVPPTVRAEGLTELIADLVLDCNGVNPRGLPLTASEIVADVSVTLQGNVTNNIDFGAGSDVTDAVLIVNENRCATPSSVGGTFGSCAVPDERIQVPQFGRLHAPNRLMWRGVRIPVPGAPDSESGACIVGPGVFPGSPESGCFPANTTLRITSMRARATAAGTAPSSLTAYLGLTAPNLTVTESVAQVASTVRGLAMAVSGSVPGPSCEDGGDNLTVVLYEGFENAWKTVGEPNITPGNTASESGYFAPGSNNGGGALHGTRVLLRFLDVPTGVSLSLHKLIELGDPGVTQDALRLQWVSGADSNGAGGTVSSGTDDLILQTEPGGTIVVAYEVVDSNPFVTEGVNVPLGLSWVYDPPTTVPGSQAMHIQALLGPVSAVGSVSFDAPEPRFAEIGAPIALAPISSCPIPQPVVDVRVEIDASPNVARPQKELRIGVHVQNDGAETAESVNAIVRFPPTLYLEDGPSECVGVGQEFVCDLGDLAAGQSVILSFAGAVDMGATSELTIFANVSTATQDANPGNDAATQIVPLQTQADLAASAYILPKDGLDSTLTVSASNRGPAHAASVKLRAQLPAAFEVLETPGGCTLSGLNLACDIDGLNPGRTKAYLLPVRRLATADGPFVTTVFVSSSTSDHKPDNNSYTLEFEDLQGNLP